MLTTESLQQQQSLLKTHRITLHHYLNQRASLGSAFMPPSVAHGIIEARDNIRRIKKVLRSWGAFVEDQPNDEEGDEVRYEVWKDGPVLLSDFSPKLLERIDAVTVQALTFIGHLESRPLDASKDKSYLNYLNASMREITAMEKKDVEITILDENRAYLVHPWFPKVVGKSHSRQWSRTQGEDFIDWFWNKVQKLQRGYLAWADVLASKPKYYSYNKIGTYKRNTVVSFAIVPISSECNWTLAVEGHEVAEFTAYQQPAS